MVDSLMNSSSSDEVETTLTALTSLCAKSQKVHPKGNETVDFVWDRGAFGSIVDVLDAHKLAEGVQASGCRVVNRLSNNEEHKQQAVEAGAFISIAAALTNHPASRGVMYWGAIAVLRLTHDSAVRAQQAIQAGVQGALDAVANEPCHSAEDLMSVHLAQGWLGFHAELIAGVNHFLAFSRSSPPKQLLAESYEGEDGGHIPSKPKGPLHPQLLIEASPSSSSMARWWLW